MRRPLPPVFIPGQTAHNWVLLAQKIEHKEPAEFHVALANINRGRQGKAKSCALSDLLLELFGTDCRPDVQQRTGSSFTTVAFSNRKKLLRYFAPLEDTSTFHPKGFDGLGTQAHPGTSVLHGARIRVKALAPKVVKEDDLGTLAYGGLPTAPVRDKAKAPARRRWA